MREKSKPREYHAKSLRLLNLEHAIRDGNYPNVEDLMKELGVSRRIILRDIQALQNDFMAPIEYDREHRGYYFTDQTFFVPITLVTEGEVVALTGLLPLMERYDNTPLKDTISKVYNIIAQMLPNQIEVQSSLLNDVQFIADPIPNIDQEVFSRIFEAIKKHQTISFGYRSIKSTEHTLHTLDPYKVYCQKGDWYVVGFCYKHQEYRTFNMSRMKDIFLQASFTPDPDYSRKVHIDPYFGIWNNDSPFQKVELLFEKSINTYILERTWHKNQECHQNEDGSVYLSFESNQMQEILYWTLRFGSAVKVLNPPELQEAYRNELKKMVRNSRQ